ncbi:ABC transporter substrate-binding protein [Achromobacter marplatensis]
MNTNFALPALLLSGLLAAPAYAAGDAQMLRVALHADIASINPGVNRDANADMVLAHVVEGLVAYGADLKIKPVLAESWQVSDEGKVYEFKLRPKVHFQNGAV